MPGDHDQPYAPTIGVHVRAKVPADQFRALWLRASRTGALTILGPPMRILMPADPNPFPRFRLWGRR